MNHCKCLSRLPPKERHQMALCQGRSLTVLRLQGCFIMHWALKAHPPTSSSQAVAQHPRCSTLCPHESSLELDAQTKDLHGSGEVCTPRGPT